MENIEKFNLNDGRRAEKRVSVSDEGHKVTELWTEEPAQLKLAEKVTEKTKEVVVERTIDTIDLHSGEILDRKIEAVEPTVKLELRQHIGVEKQAVSPYATKEEVVALMSGAFSQPAAEEPQQVAAYSAVPKVSAQALVEDRQEEKKQLFNTSWETILIGMIICGLIYLAFTYFK